MKKGILLSLLYLLVSSAPLFGAEVLTRRLSISFQNTPIKQALDKVAKLADFEWSYNTQILNAGHRVTLTANDWTVQEILREMLGEEYVFKSNGKYLILKRQKPPKTEVSGVIRATKSGERLANVTVYDRKTLRATTTDSSGYYQLKVKKKTELVVVRLGYRDTILQVASMSPRYRNLELAPVPIPPPDSTTSKESIRKAIREAATELDYFFSTSLDKWLDLNVPDTMHRRFQISFLPMLGTNHVLSKKVENDFSINILAGQSAGVRYVEAAGLGNFTQKRVSGFQAAGLFNLNRGNCNGVQAAGLYNKTADTLNGVQLAGLVNVAHYSPRFSVQVSGLVNVIRKNNSTDSTANPPKGVQLAGFANKASEMEGVQAAGFINTAHNIEGVQAAGFINTAHDVKGIQVAGFINKARRVRGFQIGIINSTKDLKGIQIGLINRSEKRWLPIVNWGK
ncbi:MAG: carboxypeptidase-like regulatory domain-containing protein [Phycisphaerae bacterium]|nr:carboxypeptidase-like regulatory domain-containing protein [Saprospiraceae bacterium]